jgi:hypothetical protein
VSPEQQEDPCQHWAYQLASLEFLCCLSGLDPASTPIDPMFLGIDCEYVNATNLIALSMLSECYGDEELQFSLNTSCDLCGGS